MTRAPPPTVRRFFDLVDTDGSEAIDTEEAEAYLASVGLEGGVGKLALRRFLSDFGNGKEVAWAKFVRNGAKLLPKDLLGEDGRLDPERVPAVFAQIAGRKRKARAADLARFLEPTFTGMAALFATRLGPALAEMTVDALDTDGDRAFTKQDLFDLLDDVNRELDGNR